MIFDPKIPVLSIILFSLSLICLIYIFAVYCRRLYAVAKRRKQCDAESEASPVVDADAGGDVINIDVLPGQYMPFTSVVVYSSAYADILADNLPAILDQKFNGRFEVIVVNDGNENDTEMVVGRLKSKYNNLYLTFTPGGSRALSDKKLAITLGIKAAKGDVVVLTDATSCVPSDSWLQELVRPLSDTAIEVVLGYNRVAMPDGRWRGRIVRTFDAAADAVTWMASAIAGKPYRGCANNIAFRRNIFFDHKGFSQSLNLRYGIDDLFVNEITDPHNCVLQISEATVGESGYKGLAPKEMRHFRSHHAFTGRSLPKMSRRLMAVGEWLMWAAVGCAVGGAFVAGVTNWFGWSVAALLIILLVVAVIVSWRKALSALGYQKMLVCLPALAAFRPLRNVCVNLTCGRRNVGNFTWQPRHR